VDKKTGKPAPLRNNIIGLREIVRSSSHKANNFKVGAAAAAAARTMQGRPISTSACPAYVLSGSGCCHACAPWPSDFLFSPGSMTLVRLARVV
jgi:hypothetical protein